MEVVDQVIGADSNVLFVTCRAKRNSNMNMSVSVMLMIRTQCECGFASQLRTCEINSTASPGFNIAYVRPTMSTTEEVTTYIENFGDKNGTISFQCIVSNDSGPYQPNENLELFNFTVRYIHGKSYTS